MGDSQSGASVLAKQGGITFVGQFFGRALEFVFLVVVTQLVTPTVYGVFALGGSIVLFTQGFFSLSLHRAIDYFVPRHLTDDDPGRAKGVLLDGLLLGVGGSLVGAAVVFAASGWVSRAFDEPLLAVALPLFCLAIPLLTLTQLLYFSFNSVKKLQYRMIVQYGVKPVSKLLLAVAFVSAGAGLFGLVGAYVGALALAVAAGGYLLWSRVDWVRTATADRRSFRPLVAYSLPLMLAGAIQTTVGQIDFFVIGYFRPSADVGIYKIGYLLASNILIVLASIMPIIKPMIAEEKGDRAAIQDHYQLATRWVVIVVLPIGITLALAPGAYLALLFPVEYVAADLVVTLLIVGFLVNGAFGPEAKMLEGLGYTRFTLLNTVVLIATNAVLDVLLVPRFGIEGAAIATASAMALAGLVGLLEILYLERIHPYTTTFAKVVLAGFAAAFAGGGVTVLLQQGVVLAFVLPVVVLSVYVVALVIGRSFTEEDAQVAAKVDSVIGYRVLSRITSTGLDRRTLD